MKAQSQNQNSKTRTFIYTLIAPRSHNSSPSLWISKNPWHCGKLVRATTRRPRFSVYRKCKGEGVQPCSWQKMVDASKARNESIAGIVSGFICRFVEHPFDTLKVQAQTQSLKDGKRISTSALFRRTISQHGWLALYRGLPSPLICGMGENLIIFAVYGNFTRLIHSGDDIPLYKQLLGGAMSGGCVSFLLTPVELIKCRMQTINESAPRYKSTLHCFLQTVRTEGIRGLFRGQVSKFDGK